MSRGEMRVDRAASLYLFQPVTRWLGRLEAGVPILMYHRVPEVDDCTTHPYYCTSTTTKAFEHQIAFLHQHGYQTVSITEAFQRARTQPSQKLVSITFDDGYQDFYQHAFPILNRHGYSATVFLPTAFIGDAPQRLKGSECLTWSEVRELRKAGIEFGSHTVTHPQLRAVSPAQLQEEVKESKQQIEDRLGEPIGTFSYPYAFPEADTEFVNKLRSVLCDSGYQFGVSTVIGRVRGTDNQLFMKRLPVNAHDDLRFFQAKLEGGYDWLRQFQYASKAIRKA